MKGWMTLTGEITGTDAICRGSCGDSSGRISLQICRKPFSSLIRLSEVKLIPDTSTNFLTSSTTSICGCAAGAFSDASILLAECSASMMELSETKVTVLRRAGSTGDCLFLARKLSGFLSYSSWLGSSRSSVSLVISIHRRMYTWTIRLTSRLTPASSQCRWPPAPTAARA